MRTLLPLVLCLAATPPLARAQEGPSCPPGYAGAFCEACDTEAGFSDRGEGRCERAPEVRRAVPALDPELAPPRPRRARRPLSEEEDRLRTQIAASAVATAVFGVAVVGGAITALLAWARTGLSGLASLGPSSSPRSRCDDCQTIAEVAGGTAAAAVVPAVVSAIFLGVGVSDRGALRRRAGPTLGLRVGEAGAGLELRGWF